MGPPAKQVLGEAAHTLEPTHKQPSCPHAWRHLDQLTETEEREEKTGPIGSGNEGIGETATWTQSVMEGGNRRKRTKTKIKTKTHCSHTQCCHSSSAHSSPHRIQTMQRMGHPGIHAGMCVGATEARAGAGLMQEQALSAEGTVACLQAVGDSHAWAARLGMGAPVKLAAILGYTTG